jgi:DNA-binding transcriptional regulator YdaS (Cro superfamily)
MRNQATLDGLARQLEQNCGDELAAARALGVSLHFVNQWRKDDKEVDERLTEAARVGTQGLVSAAIKRAVHGVTKGVYFKGVRVDEEVVYSDGLLQTLLKAKVPEFAKDGEGSGTTVNVNVANIMPRATSYEEWLAMKTQTIEKKPASLPAPDDSQVIEAEYVEVPQTAFKGIEL